MPRPSEVYSVAELALKLGIGEDTVRKGMRDGTIPCRRIAEKTYILPKGTIDRWLEMSEWQVASLLRELKCGTMDAMSPEAADVALVGISRVQRELDLLTERLTEVVGDRPATKVLRLEVKR